MNDVTDQNSLPEKAAETDAPAGTAAPGLPADVAAAHGLESAPDRPSAPAAAPTAEPDAEGESDAFAALEGPLLVEWTDAEITLALESMLFVAEQPVKAGELARLLNIEDGKRVRDCAEALAEKLAAENRGFRLVETASGFQFRTAPEAGRYAQLMAKVKPIKLTKAQLEVLAIIAYRRQVTRAQIEYLRGVEDCGAQIKVLLDHKLVRIIGHDIDSPHKPAIYSTSRQFLDFVGLKGLDQLPSAAEYVELTDQSKQRYQNKLGEPYEEDLLKGLFAPAAGGDGALGQPEDAADNDPSLLELADALKNLVETDRTVAVATGLKVVPVEEVSPGSNPPSPVAEGTGPNDN